MARTDRRDWADRFWREELGPRVRELGVESVSEWLASRPGVPYSVLLREVESQCSVNQLIEAQLEEAQRAQRSEEALLDSLARMLNHHLPSGWPSEIDFPLASAFGIWLGAMSTRVQDPLIDEDLCRRINEALIDEVGPAPGWRPSGADDGHLLRALELAHHGSGQGGCDDEG